ncbi:hypothetical protein LSAT2_012809 [Lamellibrachia satsuma]|nr:hypothetical protein LSAT2_012809 [Lamellibrachia satsuma]
MLVQRTYFEIIIIIIIIVIIVIIVIIIITIVIILVVVVIMIMIIIMAIIMIIICCIISYTTSCIVMSYFITMNASSSSSGRGSDSSSNDTITSSGELASNTNVFGNSWADKTEEPSCPDVVTDLAQCTDTTLNDAIRSKCSRLTDNDGPFAACHGVVDPAPYEAGCRLDLCSDTDNDDLLCMALDGYAAACEENSVWVAWRTSQLCRQYCLSEW